MFRSFWSWLKRLFFRKATPLTDGRRSARRSQRRLGLEGLEDRAVPAAPATVSSSILSTTALLQNPAFVDTLYQGLLNRPADNSGLTYWTGLLSGGASRTSVVNGILNSTEFINDQVQDLYVQLLGRSASASDEAYWGGLKQAGQTWQQIEAGIAASDEFFNDAGGNLDGYVTQLFQDFVHRLPNASEFGYFQSLVAAGTPRTGIAMAVIASGEASSDLVQDDYLTILSRAGDASGASFWQSQLQQGVDRGTVLAGFLGSDEYFNQLQQFLNDNTSYTSAISAAQAFLDADAKFGLGGYTFTSSDSALPDNSLIFEPNVGQAGTGSFQYLTRGSDYSAFLTETGPVLTFSSTNAATGQTQGGALGMTLVGANTNATATGIDPLSSVSNYFTGSSATGITNVANYGAVEYQNIYPGINLVYQGTDRRLQHNFVVSPGANPSDIVFSFPGYNVTVGSDGSLILVNPNTGVTLYATAPKMYQADGSSVTGGFVNLGNGDFGYQVGAYDHSQTLTIDPTIVYSTFVGGSGDEANTTPFNAIVSMAVDSSGNAYVATNTNSTNFPTITGSFATTAPNTTESVVAFKLNAAGSALVWSTYLGNNDEGSGGKIAVDASGDAYVASEANTSAPYPTTAGAFMTTAPSATGSNIVVSELNPSGSALIYSTYIAGDMSDNPYAIAVDSSGAAYVTGEVTGKSLPATAGAFQTNTSAPVMANTTDAGYVLKIAPGGGSLDYATYLTGSGNTVSKAIAIDSAGDAYVAGLTAANDFPTTPGAFQTTLQGAQSGFVTEVNPTGTALIFSTYLGGSTLSGGGNANTTLNGIAIGSSGNAYVVGLTNASNFPTTAGAYDTTATPGTTGANNDIIVTEVDASGTKLDASTYLGASAAGDNEGNAIALDSAGNVYIGGQTNSALFPQLNAVQSPLSANTTLPSYDGVLVAFDSGLTTLELSTNYGGLATDDIESIALDNSGNLYAAGYTLSNSGNSPTNGFFPVTAGAFQSTNAGGADIFVAKLANPLLPPPVPPPVSPPPPPPGTSTSPPPPYQIIVSTSDIYAPNNNSSDTAHDFGSLSPITIFSYDNLVIGRNPTTDTPGYEWFKWEASEAGAFYATLTTDSGGPLEMHLFEVQNGVLTELSNTTGSGTLSTGLSQGQAIYVEVKGQETAPTVFGEGTYNLDVALEPS